MAINKALMMTDSGGGTPQSAYSSGYTDWNSLININNNTKTKGGTQSSGAYSPSYNDLPEAEVEENKTYDTNTGNWFSQTTDYDSGSNYSRTDYSGSSSNKQTQQTEQPIYNYGDYYGTQPLQQVEQQNYYPSTTSRTTQQQTPVVQKPTIIEAEPVAEKTITPQQQNEILINSLLQQSAAQTTDANKLPTAALPLSSADAIRFGIQQSMNEQNGETATPTNTTPSTPTNEQGILNWDWRDSINNLVNLGVKPASAESDLPNDFANTITTPKTSTSWKDNFQLNTPILSGTDIADYATTETPENYRNLLDEIIQRTNEAHEKVKRVNAYPNPQRTNDPNVAFTHYENNGDLERAANFKAGYRNLLLDITKGSRISSLKNNYMQQELASMGKSESDLTHKELSDLERKANEYAKQNYKEPERATGEYLLNQAKNRIAYENENIGNTMMDLHKLPGYTNDESPLQNLINHNFEPIISRTDYSNLPEAEVNTNATSLDRLIGWDSEGNYHGGYNQNTGDLQLQSDLANGKITYKQIYDQYFNDHAQNLYGRYMASGNYSEAQAREAAITNARSQAFQKIYDLGYRFDLDNPDAYYLMNNDRSGYLNGNFINNMEKATGNNYYTNDASYYDRLYNMAAGHIEGRDDRAFDDITSQLAGNAYLNSHPEIKQGYINDLQKALQNQNIEESDKTAISNLISNLQSNQKYGTTPKITDSKNSNNSLGWNTALQAAMSGQLTKDQILHLYDSNYSDLIIPEEAKKFFTDPAHAMQQLYLNNGKNAKNAQSIEATTEEYQKALQALLDANPALKLMVDNGVLSLDDVALNFFKELKATDDNDLENKYKSYGSGGGGYSSSGYGGGGGYGGYGSSGGNSASNKNQDDTRIHNIMKNWTF